MREFALYAPVPVAELDPYGELRPAAQLRLLQLAAAKASADAGFPLAWYEGNDTTWIVRFTRLQRLAPARHGDELLIRTWVSDFRRVRSLRQYEMSRLGDGTTVARATTDWVYVDVTSGAPAEVPAEVQSALMPTGSVTEERPRRIRLPPEAADTPARPLRRVELADLDPLRHVNNSHYASFAEQAVFDALAAGGWQPDFAGDRGRLHPTEIEIEYAGGALLHQQLSARVALAAGADRSAAATVEILADGERAAAARGLWHWTGAVLPAGLRAALAAAR